MTDHSGKSEGGGPEVRPPWADLYAKPPPSTRSGVFFNVFSYPTKISPVTVAVYIAAHTKPGDTVLDVFGGSGSTGLAALMCQHPTSEMRRLAAGLDLEPTWGARNAVVYELGRYGAFAAGVMADPPDWGEFEAAAARLLREASEDLHDVYGALDPIGGEGTVRHVICSDVVICPRCGRELTYYSAMVRRSPLAIDGSGECAACGFKGAAADFRSVLETVDDPLLGRPVTRRRRVPVRVYGKTGKTGRAGWVREASEADVGLFEASEARPFPASVEAREIRWGELHRSGYHTGITHLHHFYTRRNFLVMSRLWEGTGAYPPRLRDSLRLVLLSYNAAHATLMSRVVVKKGAGDFILTGAQSGVLYVSSLPVEKNVLLGFGRKVPLFVEAFKFLSQCSGTMEVLNRSSRNLDLSDKSVDYVFTDPPFGDFIPYAEVNQINELWLGEPTDRSEEIIISTSQGKGVAEYRAMMEDVFRETARVMKDGARATVVFHASKASVWEALRSAISAAGLQVETAASLDKTQVSFKQAVSEGSVRGDPLMLLRKGDHQASTLGSMAMLEAAAAEAPGNPRRIYSSYVGKCLTGGVAVEYDAKTAYGLVASMASKEA